MSVYERIVEEPSLSILNMQAGQPGGGNSIQNVASCQIGIRTTAGQDPDRVAQIVQNYLLTQSDEIGGMKISVKQEEPGCRAWKADLKKPYAMKYLNSLQEVFGRVASLPAGGTLPLLSEFEAVFPEMEMIIPGVEDPKTNTHSHNESQDVGLLRNSINALINFLQSSGKV